MSSLKELLVQPTVPFLPVSLTSVTKLAMAVSIGFSSYCAVGKKSECALDPQCRCSNSNWISNADSLSFCRCLLAAETWNCDFILSPFERRLTCSSFSLAHHYFSPPFYGASRHDLCWPCSNSHNLFIIFSCLF